MRYKITLAAILSVFTPLCAELIPQILPEQTPEATEEKSNPEPIRPLVETKSIEEVQVFEPSKPKRSGIVPEGWKLVVIRDQKTETIPLKLPNGREAKLTAEPFLLKPDTEAGRVGVREPGYDYEKGSAASETIGGLLATELKRSQELDAKLATVIEQLEERLAAAKIELAESKPQTQSPKKK